MSEANLAESILRKIVSREHSKREYSWYVDLDQGPRPEVTIDHTTRLTEPEAAYLERLIDEENPAISPEP